MMLREILTGKANISKTDSRPIQYEKIPEEVNEIPMNSNEEEKEETNSTLKYEAESTKAAAKTIKKGALKRIRTPTLTRLKHNAKRVASDTYSLYSNPGDMLFTEQQTLSQKLDNFVTQQNQKVDNFVTQQNLKLDNFVMQKNLNLENFVTHQNLKLDNFVNQQNQKLNNFVTSQNQKLETLSTNQKNFEDKVLPILLMLMEKVQPGAIHHVPIGRHRLLSNEPEHHPARESLLNDSRDCFTIEPEIYISESSETSPGLTCSKTPPRERVLLPKPECGNLSNTERNSVGIRNSVTVQTSTDNTPSTSNIPVPIISGIFSLNSVPVGCPTVPSTPDHQRFLRAVAGKTKKEKCTKSPTVSIKRYTPPMCLEDWAAIQAKKRTVHKLHVDYPPTTYEGEAFIPEPELQSMFDKFNNRADLVSAVFKRIFEPEEVWGRNTRGQSNSTQPKEPLNTEKMKFIEFHAFQKFPVIPKTRDEFRKAWAQCNKRINDMANKMTARAKREGLFSFHSEHEI